MPTLPVLGAGTLGSDETNGGSASLVCAARALVAYTLYQVDVVTYLSGSPATPTLSGTGGETWVQVDTQAMGADRRLTKFRTMVTSPIASTVVTVSCGGVAQTSIGAAFSWVSGAATSGTDGSGAVGSVEKDSQSSVTSLAIPFAPALSVARNGVASFFCAANNNTTGLTPRTNHTELADFKLSGSNNRLQTQFRAAIDTDGSVTNVVSGPAAGIVAELVGNPNAPVATYLLLRDGGGFVQGPLTYPNTVIKAGYLNLIQVTNTNTDAPDNVNTTLSMPGVTFTQIHNVQHGSNDSRTRVWQAVVSSDVTATLSVNYTGAFGGAYVQVAQHTIGPVDTNVGSGSGVAQTLTFAASGGAGSRSGTFGSTVGANSMCVILVTGSVSALESGWLLGFSMSTGGGGPLQTRMLYRSTGDQTPSYTQGAETVALALEIVGLAAVQTVAVAQVSETDTAQTVAGRETFPAGQAGESDLAQAFATTGKVRAAGQVGESDLAQAFARLKLSGLDPVTESDLAQAVAAAKSDLLTPLVTEIDAALPASPVKSQATGQVGELDLAQALEDPIKGTALPRAAELDLAQVVTPRRIFTTAQVVEFDASLEARPAHSVIIVGPPAELDSAGAVTFFKVRGVDQAGEVDAALPIEVAVRAGLALKGITGTIEVLAPTSATIEVASATIAEISRKRSSS